MDKWFYNMRQGREAHNTTTPNWRTKAISQLIDRTNSKGTQCLTGKMGVLSSFYHLPDTSEDKQTRKQKLVLQISSLGKTKVTEQPSCKGSDRFLGLKIKELAST